jgi:prepilin-type N-terminal cleavage/methylation domain-containing protein
MGLDMNTMVHAVDTTRERRAGLTLVELLVVLALISLVAGIAVPTIARVATQNRNALRDTALDLQESLRATKVLAQTRRLDTGLAYLVRADGLAYIDGVIAVRSPSEEEITFAGFRNRREFESTAQQHLSLPSNARIMVPIPLRGPEVREFRGVGGLFDLTAANSPETADNLMLNNPAAVQEEMGLIPVYLLDHNAFFSSDLGVTREQRLVLLQPRGYGSPELPGASFGAPGAFPAHVFRPNGAMITNSSKQRFELIVAATPNAEDTELWLDPYLDDPASAGDRRRLHYRIELFASLGRVRLSTDLVAGFGT